MKIEVPDDLSTLTPSELDTLEEQADELRVAIRVQRRLMVTAAPVVPNAARPVWAQRLGRMLESKSHRYLIAVAILVVFSFPSLLQSCGSAYARYEATKRQLATPPHGPGK